MKKPQLVPSLVGSAPGPISLIIASLGNPGRSYSKTRHSAGHVVLDGLKSTLPLGTHRTQQVPGGGSVTTYDSHPGIVLMESSAYMNESGRAILRLLKWHDKNCIQGSARRLLVLHDELDLALGQATFKIPSKSKNGHNGLRSIVGTVPEAFARVRIGIGRPESRDSDVVAKYVLGKFTPREIETLNNETLPSTLQLIQQIIEADVLVT